MVIFYSIQFILQYNIQNYEVNVQAVSNIMT
jgi:hypothetical protein